MTRLQQRKRREQLQRRGGGRLLLFVVGILCVLNLGHKRLRSLHVIISTEVRLWLPNIGTTTGRTNLTVNNNATTTTRTPLPVYCLPDWLYCNKQIFAQSQHLVYTDDPHQARVAWWVSNKALTEDLASLAQTSIGIRSTHNESNNRATNTSNLSSSTIDDLDPQWNIFINDPTDEGGGDWFNWFVNENIVKITGRQRLHFVTRSINTRPRRMGGVCSMPLNTSFAPYQGGQKNYSIAIHGGAFHTVTYYVFPVRDDILAAVDQEHAMMSRRNHTNDTSFGEDIYHRARTTDVVHFWHPNVTSNLSHLRARVSKAIQQLAAGPRQNITAFTDIVGHRAEKGRRGVHVDYARALLNSKIVVVCQRDNWYDHWRLFEAMVSGALVMTDPMLHYPHGLVENETIIVYQSLQDLQDNILYYLEHEEERLAIAQRGRELSLAHHRMHHRWEQILLLENRPAYHVNAYGVRLMNWPPHP